MSKTSYANRGKKLEDLIDKTNKLYKKVGIADVRKVPTPIKITRHNKGMITGFPMNGEWVDYVGISTGRILVFDAKQTALKNLPLANIHDHQYELLESWYQYGADSFLIVHFTEENLYFYLPFEVLKWAYDRKNEGGRKSIALDEFHEYAVRLYIEEGILDYLRKAE